MPPLQDFWDRLLPRLEDWREKAQRVIGGLAEKTAEWREKVATRCQTLGDRLSAFFERIRDFFQNNSALNDMREKEARAMAGVRERLAAKTEAIRDRISAGASSGGDSSAPRPEWLEKALLAKKVALGTLNEKWLAFQSRLATRWADLWRKLTLKSSQVVEEVAQTESALETRMEARHPALAKAMRLASNPLRWMRQSPEHGLMVACAIFGLTLLTLLIQGGLWAAHRQSVIDDNSTLMYDTRSRRLRACPTEDLPGAHGAVGVTIYTHAAKPVQPAEGMSLEDLKKAGLVVGWFFRLDQHSWEGMYAAPGDPDNWIPANAENLQSLVAQSAREMQQMAGNPAASDDMVPCMTRIRDLKAQKQKR